MKDFINSISDEKKWIKFIICPVNEQINNVLAKLINLKKYVYLNRFNLISIFFWRNFFLFKKFVFMFFNFNSNLQNAIKL
jgi:hypothetical protein